MNNDIDLTNNTSLQIEIDEEKKNNLIESLQNIDLEKITENMTKLSKFVNVCNLIKNFKNLDDVSKIMEIECLLVSLKTSDQVVNGLFGFVTNIAEQGKIKLDNVLNLFVNVAEKYLNIPIKSIYDFVKNLIDGKSIKQYFIPLIVDITSILVPTVGLVNMMRGIIQGIESLFSHQSIKKIGGIDALYTDRLKIGFFKVRHKITYENEFFGIKVTHKSRHANTSKEICEREFKRQLDHKVYQVIGIPIEFINNTAGTPTTRIGLYTQKFYIEDLEENGLNVNDPYLTEEEKKLIGNMYFQKSIG